MTDTCQVEITMIVDEAGSYVASHDEDAAFEAVSDADLLNNRRVITMTITVPLPKRIEVKGEIGDSDSVELKLTNV